MPDLETTEIWRNLALICAAVIGIGLAIWRSRAADRQSWASQSQAETARRTHTTEVFKDAVAQLSHERLEIRLGAIFTLKQISRDFPDFEHYVVQVLTAYVKERSADADPAVESDRDIKEILDFLRENLGTGG